MNEIVQAAYDEITQDSEFYNTDIGIKPRLLIMSGLPMSGKSHLSNLISERLNGDVCIVRTDYIRPIIVKHMGRREPAYTKEEHALVFELAQYLVKGAIDYGWPVIADATNLKEEYRKWAINGAKENSDQMLVAFLETDHETAMERSREQDRSGSTATPAVYALLNYEKEPVEKCTKPFVIIKSDTDVRPWAESIAKWFNHEIERVPGTVVPRNRK